MPTTQQSTGRRTDPRTKEDFIDRMMARDFSGDLSDLAAGRKLGMERLKPHVLRLRFADSGKVFDLTIHKPRSEAEATKAKLAAAAKKSRKRGKANHHSGAGAKARRAHNGSAARH